MSQRSDVVSSEVSWFLVENGNVVTQSDDILDCIENRDSAEQRVTDTRPA
jgi:hypothetical protein